jgi:hypothetical protein
MSKDGITSSHFSSDGSLEYLGVAIISGVSDLNVEEALKNTQRFDICHPQDLENRLCGNPREIGVFPASPH